MFLTLDAAGENFWNNQEAAQKVINEANDIHGKIDPLARFDKQADDLRVMLELAEAEPLAAQAKLEAELKKLDAAQNGAKRLGAS